VSKSNEVQATEPQSPAELAEAISSGSDSAPIHLAKLVLMAETGGEGFIDPSSIVEGILAARVQARSDGNYQLGDDLRDILTRAGIEIKDGANGSSWSINKSS
jgi:cysteinyl-tRNA synthetase